MIDVIGFNQWITLSYWNGKRKSDVVRHQQSKALSSFVGLVLNVLDLSDEDKIGILGYVADEAYLEDNNLLYLECKQAIKELTNERHSVQAL